ncbi:MAG: PqqD family protein [Anaerolineaceae bacterium]|nr:PqqD family protein [Anaerolineaceae bacterium]
MDNTVQYQVNTSNIIHEIIDGEAIIVNMDKGHYYSLRNTGGEIWACLVKGMSIENIVNKLSERYDEDLLEIKIGVEALISELHAEKMIIPVTAQGVENPFEEEKSGIDNTQTHKFETPVLEKYTDMEELLLLDPIHEVDQSGWPNIASGTDEDGKKN